MASHRSRREVKVPARFSPGRRSDSHDAGPSEEPRKRARSPPHADDSGTERLLVQNERHHTEMRAELGLLREELGRQTRQLARCIRALVDVQDVLLDIHESTAKNEELSAKIKVARQEESAAEPEAAAAQTKRAAVEEVISLQASAEQVPIPPSSPFPSGYPTGCEPPLAIVARIENIAK